MFREVFVLALKACAVTFVLCAVAYPAVVWGLAQLLFPVQAEGSLIYGPDGRTVIGSELIAQKFESDRYFHPRPSAADYKADAAGGSNLGTNNPDLRKAIAARVDGARGDAGASGSGRPGDGVGLGARSRHQPGGRPVPGSACRRARGLADRQGPRADRSRDESIGRDPGRPAARQCVALEPGSRQATRAQPMIKTANGGGTNRQWPRRSSSDPVPSSS